MVRRIFFGAIKVPKKMQIFKNYFKKHHTEELHKKITFAPGAANHTFF